MDTFLTSRSALDPATASVEEVGTLGSDGGPPAAAVAPDSSGMLCSSFFNLLLFDSVSSDRADPVPPVGSEKGSERVPMDSLLTL